jgi:hypothetical protein
MRRYRKTLKGKKFHCQSENRRRHGDNPPKKMDDQTTSKKKNMPSIVSDEPHWTGKCHLCGQMGVIVDAFPRRE